MHSDQKSKQQSNSSRGIDNDFPCIFWLLVFLLGCIFLLGVLFPNASLPWGKNQLIPVQQPIPNHQPVFSISEEYEGEYSEDKSKIAKTTITTATPKTLWDLFSVAGVPLALVVLGFILQKIQSDRDEKAAQIQRDRDEEAAKEEILQTYFDRVSKLLIDQNILAIAAKGEEHVTLEQKEILEAAIDIIRARTLSILRRFEGDGERKGSVIRFLGETEILSKAKLDLSKTDLSGANLSEAKLRGAKLSGCDLTGADLSYSELHDAMLDGAKLCSANLCHTYFNDDRLSTEVKSNLASTLARGGLFLNDDHPPTEVKSNLNGADLTGALLWGANLRDVELSGANLSGAILLATDLRSGRKTGMVTPEQLKGEKPPLLCNVALPEGITVDPNRDCDRLPEELLKRYPDDFKTLEHAQIYVDNARRQKKWD